MKTLLFAIHNPIIVMDGGDPHGFEGRDVHYSCLWSVQKGIAIIDMSSVMSMNDRNEWVKDCVPMSVIADMEERLQAEIDEEHIRVDRMLRDEVRHAMA